MYSMIAHSPTLADDIAATLAWWRAAGVDCDFTDDATAWLAETSAGSQEAQPASDLSAAPQRSSAARSGEVAPAENVGKPIDLLGDSPPATLEEFREFWLTTPGLDTIGPRGRIAPRGAANAALMVLVIDPEESDRDRLLSGPQGRLLEQIVSAMGLGEDEVYLASALPRHTPMADTQAAAQAGLGAVLARHIELVAPKRLIAFGTNVLPLLQHGVTNGETSLREINHNGLSDSVMVSGGLDSLMAMPRLKARFWRRWIEWSAKS